MKQKTRIRKWLLDIKMACDAIDEVMQGLEMTNYHRTTATKFTVERAFEIIGEAMNRILEVEPLIEISGSRAIVNLRNQIIHGYDSISPRIVANILIVHLPILKTEIENLLHEKYNDDLAD